MSIWKRKKKKLSKTEKPEKEESVLKDFVDTLTYDKTEEEKKKTLIQMDADDKVVAVPTVPVSPQSSQVVTQAGPQQIVININIPAPLNKSEMNPEHKADMPKAPPLPKVSTITAKAPSAPRTPVIHTATVVQKSEEKPSLGEVIKNLPADKALALLSKIKPGKNLKKNMAQGYAGQPPSNLMQMSQEPLKKDVVDMSKWKRRKDKKEDKNSDSDERVKSSIERINKLISEQHPSTKKISLDSHNEKVKEAYIIPSKTNHNMRSRDQKIADALAGQGKSDDEVHAGKNGGNFNSKTPNKPSSYSPDDENEPEYDPEKYDSYKEPTKGELAAEEMKNRAKQFVKQKKNSEKLAYIKDRYKDIYGDVGEHIFDAVHVDTKPTTKERIPGTKTNIIHYGELPNGQHLIQRDGHDYANNGHLLIDKTGKITNLGKLPSIHGYYNEFQPYEHYVDEINDYNKDNGPEEEPTKADSEDEYKLKERELINQHQQRLHHEAPKALVNNIKKTKLYADITGKEQKKPEGEFDKRDYKIARGPYDWGMEVRHIPSGKEFRYNLEKIPPEDSHPELAWLKQKYEAADRKYEEARDASEKAWSNRWDHPKGEQVGKKEYAQAERNQQLARDARAVASHDIYKKKEELTKKVITPSEYGAHRYGNGDEEERAAHKQAAIRFWNEHMKNHSKVKSAWGSYPFIEDISKLQEQQKRAHLAPVKEQPQKPDNLQSRLDNWTKRNKGKIDKLPENSKLKRELADKIKGALERQASMMDTSPEANEKRKKTLEDVKRILSERKT